MVGARRQNVLVPRQAGVLENLSQHRPRLLGQTLIADPRDPMAGRLRMTGDLARLPLGELPRERRLER
jgi:hypothetical protein